MPARWSRIFVIKTGGCGGFLASVRAMGVTGQQQQASMVSEEDAVRGGAGGFFMSAGGATNPGSLLPSPAKRVPVHIVASREAETTILCRRVFIFMGGMVFFRACLN